VGREAQAAGIPVLTPERVSARAFVEELRALDADLGVVVAYGQFLGRRVREAPRLGYLVNAHASLLPRWRGAAPIARALLAGDHETGVSLMRVEREMDAGPVAAVRRTDIRPGETAGELEERLAVIAADLVVDGLEKIAAGRVAWQEQDHSRATPAPKLESTEAELDWQEPAEVLARRVRALSPRPGARTLHGDEPLRILAANTNAAPADRPPGTIQFDADGQLRIATGRGWLLPTRLQRPGGRPLETEAFLRGRPIPDGTSLGSLGAPA
jgi:methionyl-tRNA formyltransferase